MTRARHVVIALALAACAGGAPPAAPSVTSPSAGEPAPPPAPAPVRGLPTARVTLADVGLEALSLDRTADPCGDFFQFACGGWLANNPIPADRARWSRMAEVDERNQLALAALLDELAHGPGARDAASQKLGDFYAACLDEAAIERAGLAALRPLLARTSHVGDPAAWLAAVIELHKLGIFVVWDHRAVPDRERPTTYVTALDAAGLSLPDRDYYASPAFKAKLDGFASHAARLLALVTAALPPGALVSKLDSADVVAIEGELARLGKSAIERRDLAAAYNPIARATLAHQVRSIDWPAYFRGLGVAPSAQIVIGTPALFAALDRLRARFTPAQWASYFTFHAVEAMAFALGKPFEDEAFALGKLLTGVERPRARSARCVEHTASALADLLGQAYVAKYLAAGTKQRASDVVAAVVTAMGEEIASLAWMTDATKQVAIAKLDKMVRMIGYPDHWQSYEFAVKREDFAGNALRAIAFAERRARTRAGKPVERGAWQLPAFAVDAYYDPAANTSVLPAGLLQAPFFSPDRTPAVNLGGIGAAIGHELTHGFDDRGAELDADGGLADWWQADDRARFTDKAACVSEQYGTFEALPGHFIQGALTRSENIADLGGVKMAFRAYRALRKDAGKTYLADGFTEDQQFFLAFGQAWCGRERAAETERRLAVDPHAPLKFRVYGALRNLPELAEAFHCAVGTPMRPANTCTVW